MTPSLPENEMKPLEITDEMFDVVEKIAKPYLEDGDTLDIDRLVSLPIIQALAPLILSAWNARAPAQSAGGGDEIVAPAECSVNCDDPECPYSHQPLTLRQAYENAVCRLRNVENALAALSARAVLTDTAREGELSVEAAWQDLVEKTDRTSPAEYPDHALITFEELADYMRLAAPSNVGTGEGA